MRFAAVAALLASPALGPSPFGSWGWPIAPPHPVVAPYVAPATHYSAGHRGIDIGAEDGTAVLAPADGTVHFAGWVVDRPLLSLELSDGTLVSFEPVTTTLRAGDAVRRGDTLGTLEPGHCASPCLHFGVRMDGEYVSPLLFLGGVPRAVLLPLGR